MPTPEVISEQLTNLTAESLSGAGVFDTLMRTTKMHLEEEYNSQRVTGHEYATVYLGALNVVLQTSAQFIMNVQQTLLIEAQIDQIRASIDDTTNVILNRNAAQAVNAAAQATNASKVAAEITAMEAQTINENARTANDTIKTANDTSRVTAEILGIEANTLNATEKRKSEVLLMASQATNDTTRTTNDTNKAAAEIDAILARTGNETLKTSEEITASQRNTINATNKVDAEILLMTTQKANDTQRTSNDTTRTDNESAKIAVENAALQARNDAEVALLNQKKVTEIAQTVGTGGDSGTLGGVTKAQFDLYVAQTKGFARDAEQKLLKTLTDTWSIQVSSAALSTPDASAAGYSEAQILEVVNAARRGIGLVDTSKPA